MSESERRQRTISSTPRLNPEEIANRAFSTSFRGFTESEVRTFLRRVSDELTALRSREGELLAAIDELEAQVRSPRPLDEQQLLDALGEETARLLRSAKEAADDIRSKAEERAARLIEEAQQEARQLRSDADEVAQRRTEDAETTAAEVMRIAEAEAAELRATTDRYAEEQRRRAEEERDADIEDTRAEGREMVEEAKAVRERVLTDLARRRNLVQAQLEELRAGRDQLLDAYRVVKRTFLEATEALAQVEARAVSRPPTPAEVDLAGAEEEAAVAEAGSAVDANEPEAGDDSGGGEGVEGAKRSLSDVDSLFARIRAGQAEAAVAVTDADGSPEPVTDEVAVADENGKTPAPGRVSANGASARAVSKWHGRRAERIDRLVAPTVEAAKRLAQDDQNALLDAVRRQKGRPDPDVVLPALDAQLASWAGVLRTAVDGAYSAGRTAAGADEAVAPDDVATEAATLVVGPFRERVVSVLGDVEEDADESAVAGSVGARYREWKNEAVERLVGDAVAVAWSRGVYDAVPDGTLLRWVAAEEGRCPDCDDNALEPTVKGQQFPTGQAFPPAHAGCRCLLLPAEATD